MGSKRGHPFFMGRMTYPFFVGNNNHLPIFYGYTVPIKNGLVTYATHKIWVDDTHKKWVGEYCYP